jgi:tetraacyldisaccharide 4'-kinase
VSISIQRKILRVLLFPLSILYGTVVAIRNFLFDKRYFRSFEFSDVKTISVGNLTVGGTGKTPHVEYLINVLKDKFAIATLSRGYGRNTKGFHLADPTSTPASIGDEPMLYYLKYGKKIPVAVGEERLLAIPAIKAHYPATEVILLDDAYQHRWVKPNLNILLTDFNRPFYQDYILPAGRLRESRNGANRADIIIVSKSPDQLEEQEKKRIKKEISKYVGKKLPIFFTGISYGQATPLFNNGKLFNGNVILVSGISQPQPLVDYVSGKYNLIQHQNYPDHHKYSVSDVQFLAKLLTDNPSAVLLTTEKDMVKLKETHLSEKLALLPVFYLPIEIFFHEKWGRFDEIVLKVISEKEA